ncbi:MAG: tyrosine-type recombinase/integrase [Pirellulaceae bacterium]
MFYFGTDRERAAAEYYRVREDLEAGREPAPANDTRTTVKLLVNTFLSHKRSQVRLGEITQRSFDDYLAVSERMADHFGRHRAVEDLRAGDLLEYRQKYGEGKSPHTVGNEVQRIRVILGFAFSQGLIAKPVRFGEFKRPSKSAFRRQRQAIGSRIIEPPQLGKVMTAADVQLRAMIFLGLNCGFGNADVGQLPIEAIDLDAGWIEFPRPKTGIERRCPLWPETVDALRAWLEIRAKKVDSFPHLAFVTKYGQPWHRDGESGSPLSAEFRKLLNSLKLYRRGRSFYALRHCFQTVADELGDYIATRRVMGHADHSISDQYRERFPDERLRRVVNHVRDWLYPRPTVLT